MVQSREDITLTLEADAPVDPSSAQLFTGLAFRFKEPETGTQPDNTVQIEVDGVSAFVQPFLAAANLTDEPVECTLRSFDYDTKNASVGEMLAVIHLQLRDTKTRMETVSLTLGYTNSANQSFPNVLYTPESNPGLQ